MQLYSKGRSTASLTQTVSGKLQKHWLDYWPVFLPWTRTSSPAELGAAGCCSRGCRAVRRRKIVKIFHDWSIEQLSRYIQSSKPSARLMQADVCTRRLLWIYIQGIDSSGCWSLILHILLSSVAVNLNFITQKSMPPPLKRNGRFTQRNTIELYLNTHFLLKIHEINVKQLYS